MFHFNYFLSLELSSPYLKGGGFFTTHEVMVMKSHEDGVRSFAIDEFPSMDEDAIEQFWIKMVESHRVEREATFKRILDEERTIHQSSKSSESQQTLTAEKAALARESTRELRRRLADPRIADAEKHLVRAVLDERWKKLEGLESSGTAGSNANPRAAKVDL